MKTVFALNGHRSLILRVVVKCKECTEKGHLILFVKPYESYGVFLQ